MIYKMEKAGLGVEDIKSVVRRCQQGQLDAFSELFRFYQNRVYEIACIVLRDEDEAQDMVQDIFVTLFQKINTFDGRSSFETWLVSVALNRCRNRLRIIKIRRTLSFEGLNPRRLINLSKHNESVTEIISSRQQQQSLWSMVDQLDDRLRLPIVLRYRYDLSCDEIASILGRRRSTIYQYLCEGRTQLKDMITLRDSTVSGNLLKAVG